MNYTVLFLALMMAAIDAIVLPMVSVIHTSGMSMYTMIVPVLIYSTQLFIFKGALSYGSLSQMNMLWDISSDILVTLISVFLLKEVLTKNISLGLIFGIVSIYLLSKS